MILLADANPEVRAALRLVLEQQAGHRVAGEARDTVNLVAQVVHNCPQVLILDPNLPGLQAGKRPPGAALAELAGMLRHLCPRLRIVALSSRPEEQKTCEAARFDAFFCKSDPPDGLLALLAKVESVKKGTD